MGRRKWKYLPSEVRREVIRLAAMGKTIMEICAEADVGMGTVARVVGPMGGVFRPGQWSRSEFRLSPDERVEIALGLARNETFSAIAARLGRAVSTISREVNGHGGRRHYRPGAAQRSAEAAARRPKQTKLAANPRLCERVSQDLEKLRSPSRSRSACDGNSATIHR